MKKALLILIFFVSALLIAASFNSCSPDDNNTNTTEFDEALLIGKWQQNSTRVFYTYYANHTGATWDESEATEEQAQPFEWTLVTDQLEQIHIIELGGRVPKYYTLLVLSASTMSYRDDTVNRVYNFTKITE